MFDMLKVFRELFGPWVAAAPPCPKSRPSVKPRLEALEERWCPSTTWSPQNTDGVYSQNGNAAANYTNGLPSATNPLVLDGSKTGYNQPIAFSQSLPVGSITVQNGYQKTLSIPDGVTVVTTANNIVNSACTLTIVSDSGQGILLDNNNNFSVLSGGTLKFADPPGTIGSGNTFITAADSFAGEYLSNAGTVTWTGTAVQQGQPGLSDNLDLSVLNTGTFTMDGGTNGNTTAVGSTLQILGSDGKTNNVSFYQTAGSCNVQNGAVLMVGLGYYQAGGSLTSDSSICGLQSGLESNGDINIAGGKVIVDTVANSVGTLDFYADTVEINGEVDVSGITQGGNSTLCDRLNCAGAVVSLGTNSYLDVGTTGTQQLGTGNSWTVMKYASLNPDQDFWATTAVPLTMTAVTSGSRVEVSN
jgi:hypothetical protein